MDEHLRHMTDGRWHDDCRYCRRRREEGGTGVPPAEILRSYERRNGPSLFPDLRVALLAGADALEQLEIGGDLVAIIGHLGGETDG
ncbi:MAG TPA: hypothetical protein VG276_28155 [Actinomycetes bacterium]|nr:hypothetical protein [Actinomycetes bacterium]